jgi:quinoprotein glucose dehydrogenase
VWAINKKHYTNTSPPIVFKDLIIVGNVSATVITYKNDPPGRARVQREDRQAGVEVQHHSAARRIRQQHLGRRIVAIHRSHQRMGADEPRRSRGLLYMPVSTPSNDYLRRRPARQNLFAESLVCLDANTGNAQVALPDRASRLWDYDPASAPNLVTITVDGKRIDAVVQLTKQGWAFVFDRVTGKPVWPIEERAGAAK